jgi:uridylate kinase
MLCEDYDVRTVLNLSNVQKVYTDDPNKNPDAKPIDKITWEEFRKLVGDAWHPGMNAPFDPIAAKKAQELGVKVVVLSGKDFDNVNSALDGKEFTGTVIQN